MCVYVCVRAVPFERKRALPSIYLRPSSFLCVFVSVCILAFFRYGFTSRLLCTNQSSFYCPLPPALPALLQYLCTSIAQYTTPPPAPPVCMSYTIHYW